MPSHNASNPKENKVLPLPAPRSIRIIVNPDIHEFKNLAKCINNQEDVDLWMQSEAYVRIMSFIQHLSESVIDKANSVDCVESEVRLVTSSLFNY